LFTITKKLSKGHFLKTRIRIESPTSKSTGYGSAIEVSGIAEPESESPEAASFLVEPELQRNAALIVPNPTAPGSELYKELRKLMHTL
jgi:hypothetical protein